jgi:hypothetical protein
MAIIKEGSTVVSQKTRIVAERVGELTEEGTRKYKLFSLNMKVHDEFAKLGGRVYDLSLKAKNPKTDKRVVAIITRINNLEVQITRLEKEHKKAVAKRKKAKRKATRKS